MWLKTLAMTGIVCLAALIMELDFFIALPKFGAKHFGAPDDLKELVEKIPDKPRAVELCGLAVMIAAFLGIAATGVWAVLDTIRNAPGAWAVFFRVLTVLWGYKVFDIVCFDWLLLTKICFPEKMYPETAGAKGYDSFGFNAKSQGIKLLVFAGIAVLAAVLFALLR